MEGKEQADHPEPSPLGGRLPPYVRMALVPADRKPPPYQDYIRQERWSLERIARLLIGENPTEITEESDDLLAMREYVATLFWAGELPADRVGLCHPADVLLWAHWTGLELPEGLRPHAARIGRRALRVIQEFWMTREVWPLVEAINLSRGFPREAIHTRIPVDACLAPDLLEHVEDLLETLGQSILRDDGGLDVRRDDFLRLAKREGFWVPPPLCKATESLERSGASASPSEDSTDRMPPPPNDIQGVIAQYRLLALYHWSRHESATHDEVHAAVMPFMTQILGVDRYWFTSRDKSTIKYSWLRGLDPRKNKQGPKSAGTERAATEKREGGPLTMEPPLKRSRK